MNRQDQEGLKYPNDIGYFQGYVGSAQFCNGLVTFESYKETESKEDSWIADGKYTCDPKKHGIEINSELDGCFCNPWMKDGEKPNFDIPRLNIDKDTISISGFSSGCAMSMQMHVAFS